MTAPLGIFGGTFDPVHFGHLEAAREVQSRLGIKDLRLLPAGDPPHRTSVGATAAQRLAMLELALEDYSDLSIDRREMERAGPSWMVVTLEDFRAEYPDRPLLLMIGQDAANGLDSWYRWESLFELAHLVMVSRPGQEESYSPTLEQALSGRWCDEPEDCVQSLAGRVLHVPVTARDLSSSAVREALALGKPGLETWVPKPVADYIRRQGLYR